MSGTRLEIAPEQVSDVAHALLALAHEVWVLKDRVRTMEAVLEAHNIPARTEIDAHQPSPEAAAEAQREANAFVARLLTALMGEAPKNPTE
jgi:hypothetical protein